MVVFVFSSEKQITINGQSVPIFIHLWQERNAVLILPGICVRGRSTLDELLMPSICVTRTCDWLI